MATLLHRKGASSQPPAAMTLVEHLAELRRRMIVCVIVVCIMIIVAYVFYPQILTFFKHPYCEELHGKACLLNVFGPLDAFAIRLNVSAYGGIVLGSPVIFFELWRFVTPGLKAKEKRFAVPFALATTFLFLLGAYVAWLTFPHALGFLHAAGGPGIQDLFTPSKYLTLILALMAIFGLTFEFPVVLVALELARVVSPQKLAHWRRIAIVTIVIVAAVITPSSDPFSMLAMALPMLLFYEASIVIGKVIQKRRVAAGRPA